MAEATSEGAVPLQRLGKVVFALLIRDPSVCRRCIIRQVLQPCTTKRQLAPVNLQWSRQIGHEENRAVAPNPAGGSRCGGHVLCQ